MEVQQFLPWNIGIQRGFHVANVVIHSRRLKFGATYTFLNQYATSPPDGVRHDQLSGRLDFTGAWTVYDHESTAGSISLLIRSGTNIGVPGKFCTSGSETNWYGRSMEW